MARKFFFGCSFTNYKYPTWADIIIKNSDTECYNYGISGCSNETIAKTVTFADCKHNFTADDEIYIMWTHWWRKNLATHKGNWICKGNVYHSDWPRTFCRKYINYTDLALTNATSIIQTHKAYNIKLNLHWKSIADQEGGEFIHPTKSELDAIKYVIPFIPKDDILPSYDEEKQTYWAKDCHPTILWHLDLARRITNINPEVENWAYSYHKTLSALTEKDYWNKMPEWEGPLRRAYNW